MTPNGTSPKVELGPSDYLIMPTIVHVMRFQGEDEGHKVWRIACGSHLSDETWENLCFTPTLDEVKEHNLATCKRCFSNGSKAAKK